MAKNHTFPRGAALNLLVMIYRRRRNKNETVCDYLNRRRHFLIFLDCSKIKSKKYVDYILMVLLLVYTLFLTVLRECVISCLSLYIVCSCCSLFYYLANMRALILLLSYSPSSKFLKNVHYFKNNTKKKAREMKWRVFCVLPCNIHDCTSHVL